MVSHALAERLRLNVPDAVHQLLSRNGSGRGILHLSRNQLLAHNGGSGGGGTNWSPSNGIGRVD